MNSKRLLKTYAQALDADKAVIIQKILKSFAKSFANDEDVVDWIDNDVVRFWSPSYRNNLNTEGKRIFDGIARRIGDRRGKATSIDRIVLFLFQSNIVHLCQFCECKGDPSCDAYSLENEKKNARYIRKPGQTGGANSRAALDAYIKGLRPGSVQSLKNIFVLAAKSKKGSIERIAEAIAEKNDAFSKLVLIDAETNMIDTEKVVREALQLPKGTLTAAKRSMEKLYKKDKDDALKFAKLLKSMAKN